MNQTKEKYLECLRTCLLLESKSATVKVVKTNASNSLMFLSILMLEQLKSDLQEPKIALTTLLNIVLIIEETRRKIYHIFRNHLKSFIDLPAL